jgi:hypothetical protein
MFAKIVVLALLIESLLTTFKWAAQKDQTVSVWNIVALVLGVLITPLAGLDLFTAAGVPLAIPFIGPLGATIGGVLGTIFTGLIVCRGSNVIYDLYKLIANLKTQFLSTKLVGVVEETKPVVERP